MNPDRWRPWEYVFNIIGCVIVVAAMAVMVILMTSGTPGLERLLSLFGLG